MGPRSRTSPPGRSGSGGSTSRSTSTRCRDPDPTPDTERPGSHTVAGPSVLRGPARPRRTHDLGLTRSALLRTRELDRRDVGGNPRALEHDLAVAHVHDHGLAGAELLP